MNRFAVLGGCLVLSVSAMLSAGEGLVATDGRTARWEGYNDTLNQIDATPPITIKYNQYAFEYTNQEYILRRLSAYDPDLQSLYNQSSYSMGLWENLPSCRINFERGPMILDDAPVEEDTDDVVSLASNPRYSSWGNTELSIVATAGNGLVINGGDIELNREFWHSSSYTLTRVVLAQQLGRLIGFNQSILTRGVLASLSVAVSSASVMSVDIGFMGTRATLNPDDVSVASRLYPDQTAPLSRSTGSIRGLAWIASQSTPIYGAHVFAIRKDVTGKGATLHRISGYGESTGLASADPRRGYFELDGLAPGTYDVLVAPWSDSLVTGVRLLDLVILGTPCRLSLADPNFPGGFARGMVRNVTVASGEVVDLGYACAGIDRQAGQPTLLDARVEAPSSPSFSRYRGWVVRVGTTSRLNLIPGSGRVLTGRFAPGTYDVYVQGSNDGVNWSYVTYAARADWTVRRIGFTWTRATRTRADGRTAEALHYGVPIRNFALGGRADSVVKLRGSAYTMYGAPGRYRFAVISWTASDGPALLHQADREFTIW